MSNRVGRVFLVGGGPGDPGLLSLKGRDCLSAADVVLYDGLVNPGLLEHTRAECVRTSREGEGDRRRLNQEDINRQLVELGRAGKTVVRLKGGDPYIFGRGSEEALALREAGIPFEVIPGITAATAAGAYAGFSLTHRDHASAVAFVTGHEDPTKSESALDYPALAAFPGTLVFYMGLHRLPSIAASLVAAGKPPATPAAVIMHASRPTQRTVEGTLADIPQTAADSSLHPPSLIVVGECVRQRDQIEWFESQPLFGLTIGITRPEQHAADAAAAITALGGRPLVMPTIEIDVPYHCPDLDVALKEIDAIDVVAFSSQFAVHSLIRQVDKLGRDSRMLGNVHFACIGDKTAATLHHTYRLIPDLVASTSEAAAFAKEIVDVFEPRRVLWPKSDRGRDALPTTLREHGVEVVEAVAYHNRDITEWDSPVRDTIAASEVDWITLTSPSVARQTAALLPPGITPPRFAAISPLAAEAARDAGLTVSCVAADTTFESLLAAIAASRGP